MTYVMNCKTNIQKNNTQCSLSGPIYAGSVIYMLGLLDDQFSQVPMEFQQKTKCCFFLQKETCLAKPLSTAVNMTYRKYFFKLDEHVLFTYFVFSSNKAQIEVFLQSLFFVQQHTHRLLQRVMQKSIIL